jgi:hypothetical protein
MISKKAFSILLAFALIVMTGSMASAVNVNEPPTGGNPCAPANYLDNVACGKLVSQGSSICNYFDYEDYYGYCSVKTGRRVLMNLCKCDDDNPPQNQWFITGRVLGVRMEIIVDGKMGDYGVYWSDDPMGVKAYDKETDTDPTDRAYMCTEGMTADGRHGLTSPYLKMNGHDVDDNYDTIADAIEADGPNVEYKYYRALKTGPTLDDVPGTVLDKMDWISSCTITESQRVNKVESKFVFRLEGAKTYKWYRFDIPSIIVDPARAKDFAGKKVVVKLTVIDNNLQTTCETCKDICEMDIPVATLCCPSATSTCLYFPYMLSGMNSVEDGSWSAGFAVSNLGSLNPDNYIIVTLVDALGNTFVSDEVAFNNQINAWAVDNIVPGAPGALNWTIPSGQAADAPAKGACMVRVQGNFQMDGYTFLYANDDRPGGLKFGGATLSRNCNN